MFGRKAGNAHVASISRRGGSLTASSTLGSRKVSRLVSKEVSKCLTQDKFEDCRELIKNNSHNALSPLAKAAFTMAEILLSLTIIGVVAAITLPSLMGNINERTWNTQRKALHARMSQAIAMMPQLGGYGSYTLDRDTWSVVEDTAAETFLTEGLSKVLKINNICDSEHLEDCGLPTTMYKVDGNIAYSSLPLKNSQYVNLWGYAFDGVLSEIKTAAFETQNGESILLVYNPKCLTKPDEFVPNQSYMVEYICANFLYDFNGAKGPNTFGKDIGAIVAFYDKEPFVTAPKYLGASEYGSPAASFDYCKAIGDSSRVANLEEVAALGLNSQFLTVENSGIYGTSTSVSGVDGSYLFVVDWGIGEALYSTDKNGESGPSFFCVER